MVALFYTISRYDKSIGQTKDSMFFIAIILLFLIPKVVGIILLVIEDFYRISSFSYSFMTNNIDTTKFPERRKFISQIAIGTASIPFLSIIYGITKGKYNFKVIKNTLKFVDLPKEFDGFTITHISDIHSGSLDNMNEIQKAVNLINEQKSDMILFTGDIVNSKAEEMHPYIDMFSKLNSKYGNYSTLGNHDYGEYVSWKSPQEKQNNFDKIKDLHQQIGFKLLLNENVKISKNNNKISLIGVENWGIKFKKAGDLQKASVGINKKDFKILMSHDPSHWETEVKNHANNYQLTLSGHTHGFQFGIEIPGVIKWSPVQYFYKQWAGVYNNDNRFINVNRGFGFHAYAGRTGIFPEISVITLKKKV